MEEDRGGDLKTDVTIVMPHIPVRAAELLVALSSVSEQTHPATMISVAVDTTHAGATVTRNRALAVAQTTWVAFLDDDDFLCPNHLEELLRCARETEADVIYSGYTVLGGHDPWDRFGQPFDPEVLRDHSYIPVTSLVKTAWAKGVGGFQSPPTGHYEDWGFYLALLDHGARFVHHPVKTWVWNHWNGNTSGRGDRW